MTVLRTPAIGALALGLAALAGAPAWAAGGAHVIDDAEVETPGVCHLELWATQGRDHALVNAAPACTFEALPWIEFGGFAEYVAEDGTGELIVGPALKFALLPVGRAPGLGLAASAGMRMGDGRFGHASVLVPVTADLGDRVRLNLNAGWAWTRELSHEAVGGAQVEFSAGREVSLMVEAFAGSSSGRGYQAGARWTPANSLIDVDILVRGDSGVDWEQAITLGVTLRR